MRAVVWWGLIAASAFAIGRVWWAWSGPCWSLSPGGMTCNLQPDATWPVVIGVTVLAALAITVAVIQLLRRRTPTARHT